MSIKMAGRPVTRRARLGRKRHGLRVLKILEIGAGGKAVGKNAGEFTRRLGMDAGHRRILLRYANKRPVRKMENFLGL